MRKEEDFSEWYSSVIEKAELRDKRYPVKGMDVWLPYGWSVMKRIDQAWREEFDATGILIPNPDGFRDRKVTLVATFKIVERVLRAFGSSRFEAD